VWNLGIDVDKRVIAEIVASFAPARALELGCAAGAVLEVLEEHGVAAEGVEISVSAIAQATDSVRGHIHRGDLLSRDLQPVHDLVFGLTCSST
jgi:cyclopropane fatty-acyl-phospholipid synthase-like methyltransferase